MLADVKMMNKLRSGFRSFLKFCGNYCPHLLKMVVTGKKKDWKSTQGKTINDCVHESIVVSHPINLVIDTPEFQRLRRLKQLGMSNLVYPCADHSRFEHSLGVYHLSLNFVTYIASQQPELGITGTDRLCVALAGLIHDLGHGPFSHTYDCHLLAALYGNNVPWKHEKGSIQMFKRMLQMNPEVKEALDMYLSEEDYIFIEEMIDPPHRFVDENDRWLLRGRPIEKSFLYDIVSNKFDGMDVDKFDYFLRDSHYCNVTIRFNKAALNRIHMHARVYDTPAHRRICYASKVKSDMCEAADSRTSLHEKVYQHKTTLAFENMIVEMLLSANDVLQFRGDDGNMYKLGNAFQDMGAFIQLSDDALFSMIQFSSDPRLASAKQVAHQILNRQHFRKVGQLRLSFTRQFDLEKDVILRHLSERGFDSDKIQVLKAYMHRGLGEEIHPTDRIWYYDLKTGCGPTLPHQSEQVDSPPAGHVILYVYSKDPTLTEQLRREFLACKHDYEGRYDSASKFYASPQKRQIVDTIIRTTPKKMRIM